MKIWHRCFATAFLLVCLLSPIQAGPLNVLFLMGPYGVCDGKLRMVYPPGSDTNWTTARPITVRRLETWLGSDGAAPGRPFPAVDMHTAVYMTGGVLLDFYALDHYAPFTGDHTKVTVWPANAAPRVEAGEQIHVGHGCWAQFGAVSHSQVWMRMEYTED